MDLVIFDNDGVLVNSEPIACDVLSKLLTEIGLPTSYRDVLDEYLGGSIARSRRLAEYKLGAQIPAWFESAFHDRLFARLQNELRPVEDVAWVIDQLDAAICVASSGTQERVRQSLAIAGLLDRFGSYIFSATEVANGKPAPDLFLYAASKMGVHPESCVVIEDSPIGIEAANQAGMHSVGYAALTPQDQLRGASLGIIESMRDLPGILDALATDQADRAGRSLNRGV